MAQDAAQEDGAPGGEETHHPLPLPARLGEDQPDRLCSSLRGQRVKVSRNMRRQLRRNVLALDQESLATEAEPWHPAESTSASFFHVCMSHSDVRESTDVAEVFSLPRVVPGAEQKGLRGLKSYCIGTGGISCKSVTGSSA